MSANGETSMSSTNIKVKEEDDSAWLDSDDEVVPAEEDSSAPEQRQFMKKPSYILVVIDKDVSMFWLYNEAVKNAFVASLEALYCVMDSVVTLRSSSINRLAVAFADNQSDKAAFIGFQEKVPKALGTLKELKKLSPEELEESYKRRDTFDLADFFLYSKNQIVRANSQFYKRIVFYVTNDDDPAEGNAQRKFNIINAVTKFSELNIELHVTTFNPHFNEDNIYSEILQAANNSSGRKDAASIRAVYKCKNTDDLTNVISSLVQCKYLRSKFKFYPVYGDYTLFEDIFINNYVQFTDHLRKSNYVSRDEHREVKKIKKIQIDSVKTFSFTPYHNAQPLLLSQIEKEEFLETDIPIGLTLWYVAKPTPAEGWILKKTYIIENNYKNPRTKFHIFWQYCVDKNRCLVCFQKYKKASDVVCVELHPKWMNHARVFYVKPLPFASEILINSPSSPAEAKPMVNNQQEAAMEALVDAFTVMYNGKNFHNSIRSKKEAYIKSQILEEPLEEIATGVPTPQEIDEKLAKEIAVCKDVGLFCDGGANLHLKKKKTLSAPAPKKPRKN